MPAGTRAGYLAGPEGGGSVPGVIVWMEIFGLNSHIREIVERTAALGYVALDPDFFHRTDPGRRAAQFEDTVILIRGKPLVVTLPGQAIALR